MRFLLKQPLSLACLLLILLAPFDAVQADTIAQVSNGALTATLEKRNGAHVFSVVSQSKNKLQAKAFSLPSPPRIVIDIATTVRGGGRAITVKDELVKGIRFGVHAEKVRIVLDLQRGAVPSYRPESLEGDTKFELLFSSRAGSSTISNTSLAPVVVEKKQISQAKAADAPGKVEKVDNDEVKAVDALKADEGKKKIELQPLSGDKEKGFTLRGDEVLVGEIEKKATFSKTPSNSSKSGELSIDELIAAERLNATPEAPQVASAVSAEQKNKTNYESSAALAGEVASVQVPVTVPPTAVKRPAYRSTPLVYSKEHFLLRSETLRRLALLVLAVVLIVFFSKRERWYRKFSLIFSSKKKKENVLPPGALIGDELAEGYRMLGVKPTDTDTEIKARYKHLAKAFHSDKLSAAEIPEEVKKLTEDQFKKIQQAYEIVRRCRGL